MPYHNRTHAADVVSRLATIISEEGLHRRLGTNASCQILAAILAAAVHDYGHPGAPPALHATSGCEGRGRSGAPPYRRTPWAESWLA